MSPNRSQLGLSNLKPGDHLCWVYETDEEHRSVLIPFLSQGVENDEKILFIWDVSSAEDTVRYLRNDSMDVEACLCRGQLSIITAKEGYMRGGFFDPEAMIRLLERESAFAQAQGYSVLRVAIAPPSMPHGLPVHKHFADFETKMNVFMRRQCCLMLCMYDRRRYSSQMLLDMLNSHPVVVLGTSFYENFYYVPPKDLLGVDAATAALRDRLQSLALRKHAEELLRISEANYRAIFNAANDAILLLDMETGAIIDANEKTYEMWGYSPEEFLRLNVEDLISEEPPYQRGDGIRRIEKAAHGIPQLFEWVFKNKVGKRFWGEVNLKRAFNEEKNFVLAVVRDITERKWADKLLRESEERFRSIFHNVYVGVALVDKQGHVLDANEAFCGFLGYSPRELIGMHLSRFTFEEELNEEMQLLDELCSGKRPTHVMDKRYLRKDGEVVWGQLSLSAIRDNEGMPRYAAVVCKDITENKAAEQALRESQEILSGIVHSVADYISMTDDEMRVVWNNAAVNELFGPNLVGKKCHEAYYHRDGVCSECIVKKCLQDGKPHEEEKQILGPDGRRMDVWSTATVAARHPDGRPKLVVKVYRNITEKNRLKAEALRAGHLASLGELAAGVAHEINNPINGIINYAQILADRNNGDQELARISNRIIKEGDRIANIVGNLLSFARDRKEEHQPVDVRKVLSDSLGLTEAYFFHKDGIKLVIDVPGELPRIKARSQEIQQVFINILSNARYALNQKYPGLHKDKILRISAQEIHTDDHRAVRVTFHDQGTGIASHLLDRICDPFFSTKPVGEGTGLGLSNSYGIVKEHGGNLTFESKFGKYTKVMVDIPCGDRVKDKA